MTTEINSFLLNKPETMDWEKVRARQKAWRIANPDRCKVIKKRYYEKVKQELEFIENRKEHDRLWRLANPDKCKARNSRRVKFKGKHVAVPINPRTGICSICKAKGRTEMHHIQYHEDDPLKDTIEVCVRCHRHVHPRTKK